jgi:hypothetical protein
MQFVNKEVEVQIILTFEIEPRSTAPTIGAQQAREECEEIDHIWMDRNPLN